MLNNKCFVKIWPAVFLIVSVIFAACDEFCEESNRTAVVANFYSSVSALAQAADSVSVYGLNNDTPLYLKEKVSSALCPLRPTSDTTKFLFTQTLNTVVVTDTVTIIYQRHPGFISSECGCVDYASIQSVTATKHWIRDVQISNANVTTVSYRPQVINGENIKIFY